MGGPFAMGLLGAGISAASSLASGFGESSTYNQNAKVSEQNADIIRTKGRYEERQQQAQANQTLAAGRVAIAKNGGTMSGSALDVMADSAAQAEMDRQAIRYNTDIDVLGQQSQASNYKAMAKRARAMGVIGAGTALLGGLSPFIEFGGGGMKATKAVQPQGKNTFFAGLWDNDLQRYKAVNGRYLNIGGA